MSDDRLMTTSYRYEVDNPSVKLLRKSLALQKSRIEKDEEIARRTEAENKVASQLERARWFTALEEDNEKRGEKRVAELVNGELKMSNEEFMKVRRAQLRKLFLEENTKYEKELNAIGKAFYKKRI